jgi:hypothetical protein
MAKDTIYNKGIVPRGDEFNKALGLKGEVITFVRETLESTTEEAFKDAGFPQADKPAGVYADGRAWGMGAATSHFNVKIAGQTQSMMEKIISFGGKRMGIEIHISIQPTTSTMEMRYRTTEASAFRGYGSPTGPMMINEQLQFDLKDMEKFKKEFQSKMKEFAAKEAAYMTSTKLGTEDPIEKSTASMVENKLSMNDVLFSSDEDFINKVTSMKNESFAFLESPSTTDPCPEDNLILSDEMDEVALDEVANDKEVDEAIIGQDVVITKVGDPNFGQSGVVKKWHTNSNGHNYIYYTIDIHGAPPSKIAPEGYLRSEFDTLEGAMTNESLQAAIKEVTTAGAGAGSIGNIGYDAPIGKPSKRKFADTEYGKRKRLREGIGNWSPRIVEGTDGFWTVVSQETLNKYKKDHIMGAPGAEDIEINSEAEEEYNSGGIQKFPQGKAFKDGDFERHNAAKNEAQIKQKESVERYMSIDESVRKRYIHETPITEAERNSRWERLATIDQNETIRRAESVTPDKKVISESVTRKVNDNEEVVDMRNENIEEGDKIDGDNIIKVYKKNTLFSIEHLVKESEYKNTKCAYIHDYLTGTLVNNPNYQPV